LYLSYTSDYLEIQWVVKSSGNATLEYAEHFYSDHLCRFDGMPITQTKTCLWSLNTPGSKQQWHAVILQGIVCTVCRKHAAMMDYCNKS
jgi:hypothetical protein